MFAMIVMIDLFISEPRSPYPLYNPISGLYPIWDYLTDYLTDSTSARVFFATTHISAIRTFPAPG